MDWLSYAFNYVPWWIWTVIAIVLLAVFWQTLLPIWLALPKWLKGLILGTGALLTAYFAGRNRGSKDERDHRVVRDGEATGAHPLREVHKVRGRVEPGPMPRGAEDRLSHRRLALGVALRLCGIMRVIDHNPHPALAEDRTTD